MRKFLAFLHTDFQNAIFYRATGFIWFLSDIGPALIIILFWFAAYQTKSNISGYSLNDMIIYYLGVMVINSLIVAHPEYYLANQIQQGEFSNYLLKPINLLTSKIAGEIAWKIMRLIYLVPTLFIILKILSSSLIRLSLSWPTLILVIISLIFTFFMYTFIKTVLGLTAIWFGEPRWLFYSFDILVTLLSGELIPLDLFPQVLIKLSNYLPFKYFLYFPLSMLLGKLTSPIEMIIGLTTQLAWLILFFLLYKLTLHQGVKRYSAYGG